MRKVHVSEEVKGWVEEIISYLQGSIEVFESLKEGEVHDEWEGKELTREDLRGEIGSIIDDLRDEFSYKL